LLNRPRKYSKSGKRPSTSMLAHVNMILCRRKAQSLVSVLERRSRSCLDELGRYKQRTETLSSKCLQSVCESDANLRMLSIDETAKQLQISSLGSMECHISVLLRQNGCKRRKFGIVNCKEGIPRGRIGSRNRYIWNLRAIGSWGLHVLDRMNGSFHTERQWLLSNSRCGRRKTRS